MDPKAISEGLNTRQIGENVVFNLAATRPDLLTGVDLATGKPAPHGPVGVDINGGKGGECPASDGAVSTLPAGAGHYAGPVSSIHRIREHDACTKAGESDLRRHIVSTGGFIVHVSALVWAITLVTMIVIFAVDLLIVGRRPHEPSMREAAIWVGVYVALAMVFGVVLLAAYGPRYGGEFFAGWLTEYSLSVDNLFVFVIIMGRFAVPRMLQQKVLLIGVLLALLMRGALIAAGAAVVNRFVWVFYLFGAFLIYTAIALVRHQHGGADEFRENLLIRWGRRILPMSAQYDGARLTTYAGPGGRAGNRSGRRIFTPMLIVMIAIGTTDLIFALDSIPAIFGLTTQPYIVFTANVFALMGLRQLYFLLGGLLDRLVYLSYGLAAVLGFIGVKLVLDALHDNNVPFVNGGEPIEWAPHIPIWLSLVVIVGALGVATIASLAKTSRDARADSS